MPVGSDNISMQGIATSGSYETITNISLFTMIDTYAIGNPSGGNLNLNSMANKDYPSITTNAASNVIATGMKCNGNVTADGGIIGGITQRGFYFGTNANYASNTKTTVSGTTGAYVLVKTSLSSGVTYYITGYAINALGERQGSTVSQATSVSLTSYTALLNSEGGTFLDNESACNAEEVTQHTYYHDGSYTLPVADDNVYTNSGGTNDAPDGFHRVNAGKANKYIAIEGGTVNTTDTC
jgi:hypothetical protein